MNLPMLIETGMLRAQAGSLDELYRIAVNAGVESIKAASQEGAPQGDETEDEDMF